MAPSSSRFYPPVLTKGLLRWNGTFRLYYFNQVAHKNHAPMEWHLRLNFSPGGSHKVCAAGLASSPSKFDPRVAHKVAPSSSKVYPGMAHKKYYALLD